MVHRRRPSSDGSCAPLVPGGSGGSASRRSTGSRPAGPSPRRPLPAGEGGVGLDRLADGVVAGPDGVRGADRPPDPGAGRGKRADPFPDPTRVPRARLFEGRRPPQVPSKDSGPRRGAPRRREPRGGRSPPHGPSGSGTPGERRTRWTTWARTVVSGKAAAMTSAKPLGRPRRRRGRPGPVITPEQNLAPSVPAIHGPHSSRRRRRGSGAPRSPSGSNRRRLDGSARGRSGCPRRGPSPAARRRRPRGGRRRPQERRSRTSSMTARAEPVDGLRGTLQPEESLDMGVPHGPRTPGGATAHRRAPSCRARAWRRLSHRDHRSASASRP